MKIKNKKIKLVGGLWGMKKTLLQLKRVERYEKSMSEMEW